MDRGGLDKSGPAKKKADFILNWNERYLRLDPRNAKLVYFKSPPQSENEEPRGSLALAGCTFSTDPQVETRFSITSRDGNTYTLEVEDENVRSEWLRAIGIISKLGIMKEEKIGDMIYCCKNLVAELEQKSESRKKELASVADAKYRSKTRLQELRDTMKTTKIDLQEQMEQNTDRHKQTREEAYQLYAQLEQLEAEVAISNKLQQSIAEIFADEYGDLRKKAEKALAYCKTQLPVNIEESEKKERPNVNFQEGMIECINEVLKLILQNEIVVGSPVCYFDSNLQDWIPCKVQQIQEGQILVATEQGETAWYDASVLKLDRPDINDPGVEAEEVYKCYCLYYERHHMPQEQEQIRIRTQYDDKYNKLRVMTSQMKLHTRKQREVDWILEEMNRAINRLDHEKRIIDPKDFSKKQEEPPAEDEIQHILTHRQTWSEASETIFKLNGDRRREYECTQELEQSLHDREMLRSWIYDNDDGQGRMILGNSNGREI